MITAQEIRIGNYFNCYGMRVQVAAIDMEYVEHITDEGRFKIADLEPIPITKYLLKNLGLQRAEEKDNLYYKDNFAIVFGIGACSVGRRQLTKTKEGPAMVFEHLVSMIYIHHIQNLASSLCSEELMITK